MLYQAGSFCIKGLAGARKTETLDIGDVITDATLPVGEKLRVHVGTDGGHIDFKVSSRDVAVKDGELTLIVHAWQNEESIDPTQVVVSAKVSETLAKVRKRLEKAAAERRAEFEKLGFKGC